MPRNGGDGGDVCEMGRRSTAGLLLSCQCGVKLLPSSKFLSMELSRPSIRERTRVELHGLLERDESGFPCFWGWGLQGHIAFTPQAFGASYQNPDSSRSSLSQS